MPFNLFPSLLGSQTSKVISFCQLIEKIRTPNIWVDKARFAGKGSEEYDFIKKNHIEVFFANAFTTANRRQVKNLGTSNFLYLDIDGFNSEEEARLFREEKVIPLPFVAACWLSLSGHGLSVLANVKYCSRAQFPVYWDQLNAALDFRGDKFAKDYKKLCCISYDESVYVNEEIVEFDAGIEKPFLIYEEELPDSFFKDVATPFVSVEGMKVVKVELFKYLPHKHKGRMIRPRKIQEGYRHPILGIFALKLLYLNPGVTYGLLLSEMKRLNSGACEKPLSDKELISLFDSKYQKVVQGKNALWEAVSPYATLQHVFFHRQFPFGKNEKCRIARIETNKRYGYGREMTEPLIKAAIDALIAEGKEVTKRQVASLIGRSERTVQKYWFPFHEKVTQHNSTVKQCRGEKQGIYSLRER